MASKLDSVLEKAQKSLGLDIRSAREQCVDERVLLESPSLNYVFGSGFVLGRAYLLSGPFSQGKTSICTYICSQMQKLFPNKKIVYLDMEYALDLDHCEELGLNIDPEHFILLRPKCAEDLFNLIVDLSQTGEVSLFVLDSLTSLESKAQNEDAFVGFGGSKGAAVISSGMKRIIPFLYNSKASLLMVAQERQNLSGGGLYGPDFTIASGGRAPLYYSSWNARITKTEELTGLNKELIGLSLRIRNTKNKLGVPKRDANVKLYFKGGIDSEEEYMDYLKVLGLVEQKGAYYSNTEWVADDGTVGMKVCGMEKLKEYLKENPKLYANIKAKVNDLIAGHSVLDDQKIEAVDEKEAALWAQLEG
jgi:RecA/RadA recombinase|nr:MAG TPA_asm: Protein recA [Caudoviricetes sp.]